MGSQTSGMKMDVEEKDNSVMPAGQSTAKKHNVQTDKTCAKRGNSVASNGTSMGACTEAMATKRQFNGKKKKNKSRKCDGSSLNNIDSAGNNTGVSEHSHDVVGEKDGFCAPLPTPNTTKGHKRARKIPPIPSYLRFTPKNTLEGETASAEKETFDGTLAEEGVKKRKVENVLKNGEDQVNANGVGHQKEGEESEEESEEEESEDSDEESGNVTHMMFNKYLKSLNRKPCKLEYQTIDKITPAHSRSRSRKKKPAISKKVEKKEAGGGGKKEAPENNEKVTKKGKKEEYHDGIAATAGRRLARVSYKDDSDENMGEFENDRVSKAGDDSDESDWDGESDRGAKFKEMLDSLKCPKCNCGDEEDKIVLCDGCNIGYHIYCLDPPLERIPPDTWYCPTCTREGKAYDTVLCRECGGGEDAEYMLLCDGCENGYHMLCLKPIILPCMIPEGAWYCPSCIKGCVVCGKDSNDSTAISDKLYICKACDHACHGSCMKKSKQGGEWLCAKCVAARDDRLVVSGKEESTVANSDTGSISNGGSGCTSSLTNGCSNNSDGSNGGFNDGSNGSSNDSNSSMGSINDNGSSHVNGCGDFGGSGIHANTNVLSSSSSVDNNGSSALRNNGSLPESVQLKRKPTGIATNIAIDARVFPFVRKILDESSAVHWLLTECNEKKMEFRVPKRYCRDTVKQDEMTGAFSALQLSPHLHEKRVFCAPSRGYLKELRFGVSELLEAMGDDSVGSVVVTAHMPAHHDTQIGPLVSIFEQMPVPRRIPFLTEGIFADGSENVKGKKHHKHTIFPSMDGLIALNKKHGSDVEMSKWIPFQLPYALYYQYMKEKHEQTIRESSLALQTSSNKPPKYISIRRNVFTHRPPVVLSEDDIHWCNCKEECGDDCINRLIMLECNSHCQCGSRCNNQRFARREYAPIKVFKTSHKGWGLMAKEDIREGDFVIEYQGEVISLEESQRRLAKYHNEKTFYMISLTANELVDASRKSNRARFMNHSCEPNCETQKWMVNGEVCVGIFAKKDVKKGEELTFDYSFERYGFKKHLCFCGAKTCRGYIGGADKPNSQTTGGGAGGEKGRRGKKKKRGKVSAKDVMMKGRLVDAKEGRIVCERNVFLLRNAVRGYSGLVEEIKKEVNSVLAPASTPSRHFHSFVKSLRSCNHFVECDLDGFERKLVQKERLFLLRCVKQGEKMRKMDRYREFREIERRIDMDKKESGKMEGKNVSNKKGIHQIIEDLKRKAIN